jgi:hypothetical protein
MFDLHKSRPFLLCCAWGAFMLAAGCMSPTIYDPARVGPFFTPTNHVGFASLGGIRRVILLPAWTGRSISAESAADLDPVCLRALQLQNRFEVVTLSRTECHRRFGTPALSSAAALPHDLLAALRKDYAVDAVMFVDITTYQGYRPLALGIRAKLALVDGVTLVWSFDNVFSADDPTVANSARHYFIGSGQGVPADLTPAVLQSPSRFAAYVADATFRTLPPVTLPPVAERSAHPAPPR